MSDERSSGDRDSLLLAQLREISGALDQADIDYALIGGVAVNSHGYLRATHDLDILSGIQDEQRLHALLIALGYEALDRRQDISSYARGPLRLDIVHAHRSDALEMLGSANDARYADIRIPVISLEGLIGLKLQAFNDDPRRLRDLDDIMQLMKLNRADLDIAKVRSYFTLFGREELLDDILRTLD